MGVGASYPTSRSAWSTASLSPKSRKPLESAAVAATVACTEHLGNGTGLLQGSRSAAEAGTDHCSRLVGLLPEFGEPEGPLQRSQATRRAPHTLTLAYDPKYPR